MKLTTKGRFAVSAMVDLAKNQAQGPVPLAAIAERQEISLSYLEQLFARLRRAGLVVSSRGPGGGYRVAKPLEAVTIAAIVDAVDEGFDTTRCGGRENCHHNQICATHYLWENLNLTIQEYLNQVTLAQLVLGEVKPLKEKNPLLRIESR